MENDFRERRGAELRAMQGENPRRLIEKYCEITGQASSSQLPHGVSFSRMIETILDRETLNETSSVATK